MTEMDSPIYEIIEGLYLSSFGGSKNIMKLKKEGITKIINVSDREKPTAEQSQSFEILFEPIPDTPEFNITNTVNKCANLIHQTLKNKQKILVHCSAGCINCIIYFFVRALFFAVIYFVLCTFFVKFSFLIAKLRKN